MIHNDIYCGVEDGGFRILVCLDKITAIKEMKGEGQTHPLVELWFIGGTYIVAQGTFLEWASRLEGDGKS